MGNLLTYSAITAKLKAMSGRLLTDKDFRKLAFSDNVSAAVEALKSCPSYSGIFDDQDVEALHREQIEQLLWVSLYRDFSSLYRFATIRQRAFLDLYFMHFEIDIMKKCLRDAASGRPSVLDLSSFEEFFRKHSHLNLVGLAQCTSIEGFIEGLSGSFYYAPLKELLDQGVSSPFDYESALDILYFIALWKNLKKKLDPKELGTVIECIGEKIDLLNLEWLARAKQHYHLSEESLKSLLIPVYFRLRKKQVQELAATESKEEFIKLLRTTRYGNRIFSGRIDLSQPREVPLKKLFRSLLDAVYQASGRKNPYSAASINTYFYFKEEETRKLITTIEGIRYHLDGNSILSCLAES